MDIPLREYSHFKAASENHVNEDRTHATEYGPATRADQQTSSTPSGASDMPLNTSNYYPSTSNEQQLDESSSYGTEHHSTNGIGQSNSALATDASNTALETHHHPSTSNEEYIDEGRNPSIKFDSGRNTRLLCVVATCVGTILAIASIANGLYIIETHPEIFCMVLRISPPAQKVLSLTINIVFTLCSSGMMFTHDVSLRWALYHEGRLEFNTNLRLFTSSKKSGPNRWYTNLALLISLAVFYGSLSTLILPFPWSIRDTAPTMKMNAVQLNGVALLGLGISLGVQAGISIWCLVSTRHSILTWSSNPLNTTLALIQTGNISRDLGRSLLSVHQRNQWSNQLARPARKQGSMVQANHHIWYILMAPCVLAIIAVSWAIATAVTSSRLGGSEREECLKLGIDWKADNTLCPPNSKTLSISLNTEYSPSSLAFNYLSFILIFSTIHSIQSIGLHLVELIVNLSRDESVWQRAYSNDTRILAPGAQLFTNPFKEAVSSPVAILLLAFKAALHWALSQSVLLSVYVGSGPADSSGASQVQISTVLTSSYRWSMVYAGLCILYAIFATFLTVRRRQSYQPAAFGHLKTLANLVDDWETNEDGRFWWGDKSSDSQTAIRYAGTSSKRELLSQICSSGEYH